MFIGMSLHCGCVQEHKVELKQKLEIHVRLLAKRPDMKERKFDQENEDAAWAFAGPYGVVMKWSGPFGQFVPMRWPEEYMVFFKGRRGRGNKSRALFFGLLDPAIDEARNHRGMVFRRRSMNSLADLIHEFE